MKLLYVKGSPRGERSRSAQVAAAFVAAWKAKHPDGVVEELDLWQAALPQFDGDFAAAKMSFFGDPAMDGAQQSAWNHVMRITRGFTEADEYLFTVPMWNGGIPYMLKLYIDILTQPGLLFSFDPASGYRGLLSGKRATAVYTSGVYGPGMPKAFGTDFHSTYFDDWLRFIGIDDITEVRYQPNILTADAAAGLALAQTQAAQAGAR